MAPNRENIYWAELARDQKGGLVGERRKAALELVPTKEGLQDSAERRAGVQVVFRSSGQQFILKVRRNSSHVPDGTKWISAQACSLTASRLCSAEPFCVEL